MDERITFLRARLDGEAEIAQAATPGPWVIDADDGSAIGPRCDCGRDNCAATAVFIHGYDSDDNKRDTRPDAEHVALHDPARVLRKVEAKRELLDNLLSEKHTVVDDCWYTCAAATEDIDGGECCDDSYAGGGCTCGRDDRIMRRLRLLIAPYSDHPDFKSSWLGT